MEGAGAGDEQLQKEGLCKRCVSGLKWQLHLNLFIVTLLQLPLAIIFSTPISSLYLFVTSGTPPVNSTQENGDVDWHGLGQSDTFYSLVVTVHGVGILLAAMIVIGLSFLRVFRVLMPICLLLPIASGILYANSTEGWMIAIAHFFQGIGFGCLEVLLVSYISVTCSKLTNQVSHNYNEKRKCAFSMKDKYLATTLIFRTIGWTIGLGISSLIAQFEETVDQFRWPGWANSVIVSLYAFLFLALFRHAALPGDKSSTTSCTSLKSLTSHFQKVKKLVKRTKFKNISVLLYLGFSAHVMASMGTILGTIIPPILSDHFGFNITFVSYFTLAVMGTSFIGGMILIILKCMRINNRRVYFVVLIAGICGATLMSDWQAIGSDPCHLESTQELDNAGSTSVNDTLQEHLHLNDLCVSQSGECYWNQDSLLTGTFCFLCRPVCRSKSMTINIIQFCIGVVAVHLSALIGWTTVVGIATDCTPTRLQSTVVGILFVTAGVAWLVTPLWSISIYNIAGKRTFAPLTVWNALQLLSLIGLCVLYKHLGPVKSPIQHL